MIRNGRGPFARASASSFDAWFRSPLPDTSSDPRFAVRRVHPDEFDRVYDLVDEAFGTRRSRSLYDWLYRHNPHGVARCWIVVERSTGRLVASLANCPWPLARGREALLAALGGDCVVAPQWQGQGLNRVRTAARDLHPIERATVRFGWPNAKSRGAARKGDIDGHVAGPVPSRGLPLHAAAPLIQRGWPRILASAAAYVATPVIAAWTMLRLHRRFAGTVEPVRRFDAVCDPVTERCMGWDGYWFPHDADFLNWRYLEHPTRQYVPLVAATGTAIAGYCVVQIDRQLAWLMEFAAPAASSVACALLLHAISVARRAGSSVLTVCAPPSFPHWPLIRSTGFMKLPLDLFFFTSSRQTPDMQPLERWQFLAGDIDAL